MKKNFKKLVLNKSTLSNLDSGKINGGRVESLPVRIFGLDVGTKPVGLGFKGCGGITPIINDTNKTTTFIGVTQAITCDNSKCTKC